MSKYIYFHIWENHFKMWGYDCFRNEENGQVRIVFYWGRIKESLSRLQHKEKVFDYWADGYSLIKKKVDEKIHKGYVPVLNTDYHKFSCGEMTLHKFLNIIRRKNV